VIDLSEPTEEELEEIWQFVNCYFDLNISSKNVKVNFGKCDEILKDCRTQLPLYFNEMEKKLHSQIDPKDLETQKDAEVAFAQIEGKGELRPIVCIFTDRLNAENRMYQEFLRNHYSRKDYITFLVIHEFIHVLEHLIKKQLLTEPTLDIKIFLSFYRAKL
jgi:predicted GTPase